MASAVIERVVLRNYRSIRACRVELGPLTFLVGPNGSGKSNFLDALRLVSDSLTTSLDQALRERGGISEVRRVPHAQHPYVDLRLDLTIGTRRATYSLQLGMAGGSDRAGRGFWVNQEECVLDAEDPGQPASRFRVEDGVVRVAEGPMPPAARDRLYLVTAAGLPAFRPVYDALSQMGFYNLNPDAIRDLQTPDAGELLARDGHNLASVVRRLAEVSPAAKRLIDDYLAAVVPGVEGVSPLALGPRETIEFQQRVSDLGDRSLVRFPAQSMSDGTLRALGVLTAVFQAASSVGGPTLVGIEEPEMAVHPAAAGVLREAIVEASRERQIVVTSHSPELLDDLSISADAIRAVRFAAGATDIGPLDLAGRRALEEHLFTAGELLRVDQLAPDAGAAPPDELDLFGEVRQ